MSLIVFLNALEFSLLLQTGIARKLSLCLPKTRPDSLTDAGKKLFLNRKVQRKRNLKRIFSSQCVSEIRNFSEKDFHKYLLLLVNQILFASAATDSG